MTAPAGGSRDRTTRPASDGPGPDSALITHRGDHRRVRAGCIPVTTPTLAAGLFFIYQPGRIGISPDPDRLAYHLPQIAPGRVDRVLDQEESNSIDGVLYLHGSSGIASGFGPAALRFDPTASTSGEEVG